MSGIRNAASYDYPQQGLSAIIAHLGGAGMAANWGSTRNLDRAWRAGAHCCAANRSPVNGIVACGAYLPYFRLDRKAIGDSLGVPADKGTRSVASYDEDTTSMAVEPARAALRSCRHRIGSRR